MSGSEVIQAAAVPDRGPAVFAVTTATLVLASVFVAARMFSRIRIVRRVAPDDYIICVAWLIAFFLSMTIELGATRGLGRHDADIPEQKRPNLRKCEYVFSVLYNPALMATKTSILVFYLRLAKNTQKILRLASWATLGIVNVAGVVLTFMNIFQCRPVAAAWNPYVRAHSCIPLLTEFVCSAPVNIVTNLAILALPIPVLTGMRLPQRQKIILVLTFSLGIFVTIVDVVRIYYLQQAITYTPMNPTGDSSALFGDTPEFSWNASLSLMWSVVEVNVGIAVACVPTLKPLILRILPAMLYDPDGTRRSRTHDSKYALDVTPPHDSTDNNTPQTPRDPQAALQSPPAAQIQEARDSEEVSIRDFLARSPGAPPPDQHLQRGSVPRHASTTFSSASTQGNIVFFGFVNMKRPRSMLRTSVTESWKYCTAVTILFFLWGFSYGLLNTLNNVIAAVANMTEAQTLGLTSIYFGGGYFFGPLLVGEWLVRHDEHQRSRRHKKSRDFNDNIGGFRITFIVGLLIYGTGTMAFWPSAVLTAFGGFMVSNFIVGFGLGVLETAANPFLALCGPMQYSEMRLCLAQGVQAVGSVLSGLLAQRVFFNQVGKKDRTTAATLLDVQWTYLAITLFCVLLALFFYYMPLPEVSDSELELLASKLPVNPKKRSIGGLSLRNWTIILAVTAQWTYIAAQESMSIYFGALLTTLLPPTQPTTSVSSANDDGTSNTKPPGLKLSIPDYLLVAHTAFAVSRFAAGYISYLSVRYPKCRAIPTPRTMLSASALVSVVFALLVVVLRPHNNANMLVIPVVLFFLAEGPLWPLIFALGLRGQGKRTKRAGAWLTMGASGPAFWPFVLYGIVRGGGSLQTAFVVVVVLLVFTFIYPVFLTVVKDAKMLVDVGEGKGGGVNVDDRETGSGDSEETPDEDVDAVVAQRQKQKERNGSVFGRFNWGGKRENGKSSGATASPPSAEEREQQAMREATAGEKRPAQEPWENQDLDTTVSEEGSREQPRQGHKEGSTAPWEDQELDTTILEKP